MLFGHLHTAERVRVFGSEKKAATVCVHVALGLQEQRTGQIGALACVHLHMWLLGQGLAAHTSSARKRDAACA